jgi:hypothetical protein
VSVALGSIAGPEAPGEEPGESAAFSTLYLSRRLFARAWNSPMTVRIFASAW